MNENSPQTPHNREYEDFPDGQASRVMYVERTSGAVEGGWIAAGSGVRNGVEYTRVVRSDGENVLLKEVETSKLEKFDAKVREQNRLQREAKMSEAMGELAIDPTVADEPNPPPGPEVAGISSEKDKDPRYEKLFQPLVRPELLEKNSNYDHMFGGDDAYNQGLAERAESERRSKPQKKAQREYDRFVNEETKRISADYVSRTLDNDPDFARVIREAVGDKAAEEVVDALREDVDVRYDTGMYLLAKLDDLVAKYPHEIPDRRVVDNGQKKTDAKAMPLEYVSSREYAAYLALAKLDGSFNGDLQTSTDGIDYDRRTGKVAQAQHRYTADFLLNN